MFRKEALERTRIFVVVGHILITFAGKVQWRIFSAKQRTQGNVPYAKTCVFFDKLSLEEGNKEYIVNNKAAEKDSEDHACLTQCLAV